ncbi:MAG: S8 family peptidase [Ginsengibacter sp.]
MKKLMISFLLSIIFSTNSSAQYTKYVVKFRDKAGTPFSTNQPSAFLSKKSIDRRLKQNILIDESDLPIVPRYIDSLRVIPNVSIVNSSKWLNQVCIETTEAAALAKINSLSFVIGSQPVKKLLHPSFITRNKFKTGEKDVQTPSGITDINYGNSFAQIHIHEGEFLHNNGFKGEGMLMAIIDDGFYHYQTLPAFDSVRINNQIIETYDFVKNSPNVNDEDAHGMQCFSIIAANIPGQFVGSSPKANFLLYRSEDVGSESPIEEQNWAAAAERSDSAGVDVISTSLGYTTFDNSAFNYTYADMNGHTTMIAKAASIAAKKGIIVLVAAGNEGNQSWKFISTPADADSVLTVAAVNASGIVAGFSSYGPSFDQRIKPTVASVGVGTTISSASGAVSSGNGTSFATPNLAGLVTCLWQAYPEFSSREIIEAVKKSSSIYNNPDIRIGYGIPNFRLAFEDLKEKRTLRNVITILAGKNIKIFPNPATDQFSVVINPQRSGNGNFYLYDAAGKLLFIKQTLLQASQPQVILFASTHYLPKGIYILKFHDGVKNESFKIVIN